MPPCEEIARARATATASSAHGAGSPLVSTIAIALR
jgi:hypothetical protein